ncbi:MAG: phosphoribosylaminoimidazolesuccinocarboxamide synthase [Oscillospiraceae bacterium]|nr:phosphoribosylaminoimidazolesuccinocarboxamide synthase [Oscillospiraceae bacterium]
MKYFSESEFPGIPLLFKGKVRDIYDLGDSLLIVVSDRISAFDVVFNEAIPGKGVILNSLSAFWFDMTKDIMPNHVRSTDPSSYPKGLSAYADKLDGRSMWVDKAEMLPVECIVRGYLEGSALKEYNAKGTINGVRMPRELKQADRLPEPVFSPSTKAESGHDINITIEETEDLIGKEDARAIAEATLALYSKAAAYAMDRGLILADTKLEFGKIDGRLVVADEMFTPDSSRFWDANDYEPGRAQKSFDKQYLREYLETLDWDKSYPPPALPPEIIAATSAKYRDAYRILTGKEIG